MLTAFPELMKIHEVFKMKPRTNAGYGERYNRRKVEGYWSWRKQSKMDVEGDLRTPDHQATFWVQCDFLTGKSKIGQGDYVEVDKKIFVVVDDQDFTAEGGFSKCLMQRLAGPDGRQVPNRNVENVIRGDY